MKIKGNTEIDVDIKEKDIVFAFLELWKASIGKEDKTLLSKGWVGKNFQYEEASEEDRTVDLAIDRVLDMLERKGGE